MYRAVVILIVIAIFVIVAGVFAWLNPGMVDLELAFTKVQVAKSHAFTVAFALGWLFGILCSLILVLRLLNERRHLRKSVRLAEAEVKNLRSLPLQDAG